MVSLVTRRAFALRYTYYFNNYYDKLTKRFSEYYFFIVYFEMKRITFAAKRNDNKKCIIDENKAEGIAKQNF